MFILDQDSIKLVTDRILFFFWILGVESFAEVGIRACRDLRELSRAVLSNIVAISHMWIIYIKLNLKFGSSN